MTVFSVRTVSYGPKICNLQYEARKRGNSKMFILSNLYCVSDGFGKLFQVKFTRLFAMNILKIGHKSQDNTKNSFKF